jgi:hypothetical protein
MAGESRDFVRSAYFSTWLRKRHVKEPELLDVLKGVELAMIEDNLEVRANLSRHELGTVRKALGRIRHQEMRWRFIQKLQKIRKRFSLTSR